MSHPEAATTSVTVEVAAADFQVDEVLDDELKSRFFNNKCNEIFIRKYGTPKYLIYKI